MLISASPNTPAPPAPASWQPLLDGSERARALELVRDIAQAVGTQTAISTPSLLGGAGIAVFCAYAAAADVIDNIDIAGMLAACVERAGEISLPIGLWNGCAGLRWAIAHLADGEVAEVITARLDAAVYRALAGAPAEMSVDLYSGLAGVLLAYADDTSALGLRIAGAVVERLAAIDWTVAPRMPGCAHGIGGVAAALACWLHAQTPARAEQMTISQCLPWALGHEACHDHESRQTISTDDDCHVAMSASRTRARQLLRTIAHQLASAPTIAASWCTGGPGVALALLSASRVLHDEALADHAVHAMRHALAVAHGDAPPDATLCHGAAGLAHLGNRLYQATGDCELGERARDWLRRTMATHVPGIGVAGFRRLRRKPTLTWEADPSLLVGAAGIGLTLLAAATSIAPLWDRTLAADVCLFSDEEVVRH